MNYKTPQELGITEEDFNALVIAREAISSGRVKHVTNSNYIEDELPGEPTCFNMCVWHEVRSCGSIACIGGTAESLAKHKFSDEGRDVLDELFFPNVSDRHWSTIDNAEATQAIDNMLSTGSPHWQDILNKREDI